MTDSPREGSCKSVPLVGSGTAWCLGGCICGIDSGILSVGRGRALEAEEGCAIGCAEGGCVIFLKGCSSEELAGKAESGVPASI